MIINSCPQIKREKINDDNIVKIYIFFLIGKNK